MYCSSDFGHLFIRYQAESLPVGKSILCSLAVTAWLRSPLYIILFCMLLNLIIMLLFIVKLTSLSWERYTKEVILNILLIMTVSIPVPYIINEILPSNIYSFILVCIVSLLSTLSSIFFLGLKSKERLLVVDKMKCFCRC